MLFNVGKRVLMAVVACCVLMLTYVPANAEELQDSVFTYKLTEEGTASLTGTVNSYPVGHLEIPASVQGYTVTKIEAYAFQDYSDITSVTIPNTVKTIDSFAFDGCVGITDITIPESVIYLGQYAFGDCTGLRKIDLPETAIEIDYNCFNGTPLLTDTANWDGDILYIDNHMIDLARSYTGACIVRPGTVTIANHAFLNADEITLSLPEGLKRIGETMLGGNIGELYIPGSVEIIGERAFAGVGFNKLIIGDGVKQIGKEAFCGSDVSQIEIPGSVERIGTAAFQGNGVQTVIVGEGVKEIGERAFAGCRSLTEISLPTSLKKLEPDILRDSAYAEDVQNWKAGLLCVDGCLVATRSDMKGSVEIEEGIYIIADHAFNSQWGSHKITSITLPSTLTHIGQWAFACTDLSRLELPDGLLFIGDYCFKWVKELQQVKLPDSLTNMGEGAFYGCENLEKATLSNSLTALPDYAFYECGLTEITVPGSIESVGDEAFLNCRSLKTVILSEGVTAVGSEAFDNCINIAQLELPSTLAYVGPSAFTEIRGIQTVNYNGSQSQWDAITVESENSLLKLVTVSDPTQGNTEPTEATMPEETEETEPVQETVDHQEPEKKVKTSEESDSDNMPALIVVVAVSVMVIVGVVGCLIIKKKTGSKGSFRDN